MVPPDSRMMLTRGSEEFDLWNGVRFSLPPGKHVLKVTSHSKYANLEGLQVTRTLAGVVSAKFSPLTEDVQGKVTIPGYGGVFLADEDAAFRVCFTNQAAADVNLKCRWTALDYRGKEALTGDFDLTAATGKETAHELKLDVKEPGRYVIRLKYSSPEGEHEVFHRFVKLPKLDYPRLVMRAEESQQVRDRIAKYPVMFQRYRDYLRRQSEKKDFMPVKFRGSWGQDQTLENAKWRAICLGFADNFLEGENPKRYEDKLLPLLTDPGGYDAWQGNYEFGGPQTLLYDLMLGSSKGAEERLEKYYRAADSWVYRHDYMSGSALHDFLLALKEPPTAQDRFILWRIAMELNNYDAYFGAHPASGAETGSTGWERIATVRSTR